MEPTQDLKEESHPGDLGVDVDDETDVDEPAAKTISPTSAPTFTPTVTAPETESPSSRKNIFDKGTRTAEPTPRMEDESSGDEKSGSPTRKPTDSPSVQPTPMDKPTEMPSQLPSVTPSTTPSSFPSQRPSDTPSYLPSDSPTDKPSLSTLAPTRAGIQASESKIETNAPATTTVVVNPDGTSKEVTSTEEEPTKAANEFLEAWEKLAMGTTWFEYFF